LSAVVRRSDFGMDRFLDLVSDEVRLSISVEGIREGGRSARPRD
jgi:polyisoprenoid-binding protein YceI